MTLADFFPGEPIELVGVNSSRRARSLLLLGLHDRMVVSVASRGGGGVVLACGEARIRIPAYLADAIVCRRAFRD